MHIVDIIMRIFLASIGWYTAFVAGKMRQAEETWILGLSLKFTMWLLAVGSAVFLVVLAMI